MSADSALDVVVVTRETRDVTLRCAEAVLGAPESGPARRLIVIDNGSSDGTAEAIAHRWPEATVLRNEADAGYARACNQGVRAGRGEYVLILNSDAFPRPGALERLVAFLEAHPGHSSAAGQLVDAGTDRPQVGFAVRGYPTLAAQVALLVGLERCWPGNPLSRRQALPDFDYGATQDLEGQPAGACLACRRADFEAVGGFDEDFHYWFEDVDLVRRLRARGPVAYVHDAVFDHLGGATFGQWDRPQVVRTRYRSLLRYFEKHHSRGAQLGLRAVVGALAAVRVPPLALFAPARARAYLDVVRMAIRR
jgi:GT2 family glycosyltransferase